MKDISIHRAVHVFLHNTERKINEGRSHDAVLELVYLVCYCITLLF